MPFQGGLLCDRLGAARVAALRGLGPNTVAAMLSRDLGLALESMRHVHRADAVFLSGGLAALPGLELDLPFPVYKPPEPRFGGEIGGRALLREMGHERGLVVDIGQTAIKISGGAERVVRSRDLDVLPIADSREPPPRNAADLRDRAVAFFAEAIQDALDDIPGPIVLALPCELDDQGVPGSCTYGGLAGDRGLLGRIVSLLEPRPTAVLALNDAELVGLTARELHPRVERMLVVTLGYGPGAALVERARAERVAV